MGEHHCVLWSRSVGDGLHSSLLGVHDYSVNEGYEGSILGRESEHLMKMRDYFNTLCLASSDQLRERGLYKESALAIEMKDINPGGLYRRLKL